MLISGSVDIEVIVGPVSVTLSVRICAVRADGKAIVSGRQLSCVCKAVGIGAYIVIVRYEFIEVGVVKYISIAGGTLDGGPFYGERSVVVGETEG